VIAVSVVASFSGCTALQHRHQSSSTRSSSIASCCGPADHVAGAMAAARVVGQHQIHVALADNSWQQLRRALDGLRFHLVSRLQRRASWARPLWTRSRRPSPTISRALTSDWVINWCRCGRWQQHGDDRVKVPAYVAMQTNDQRDDRDERDAHEPALATSSGILTGRVVPDRQAQEEVQQLVVTMAVRKPAADRDATAGRAAAGPYSRRAVQPDDHQLKTSTCRTTTHVDRWQNRLK